MSNVILIAKNVLKIAFKKKSSIVVYFVLPLLCILLSLVLYSNAANGTVTLGINDNSTLSRDMINVLKSNDKFRLVNIKSKDVDNNIVNKKVDCVLVIPEGFQEGIYDGSIRRPQLISIKGESVTAWVKSFSDNYIKNLADISTASNGNKEMFDIIYEGYKKQDIKLTVSSIQDKFQGKAVTQQGLGLFIMFILVGATTTANFILKEKADRTYYRTFCAPVNSGVYIAGNILANLVIVCTQNIFIIFFTRYVLHIDTGIPDIELFSILIDFGLVSIAFGILLVAFSKTRRQAGNLSTLIITPTCMLSGCFWPLSIMPAFLKKVADFLPQTWVMDAISKGQGAAGFSGLLPDLILIFAFAAAFLLVGIYKLRINKDIANFV